AHAAPRPRVAGVALPANGMELDERAFGWRPVDGDAAGGGARLGPPAGRPAAFGAGAGAAPGTPTSVGHPGRPASWTSGWRGGSEVARADDLAAVARAEGAEDLDHGGLLEEAHRPVAHAQVDAAGMPRVGRAVPVADVDHARAHVPVDLQVGRPALGQADGDW